MLLSVSATTCAGPFGQRCFRLTTRVWLRDAVSQACHGVIGLWTHYFLMLATRPLLTRKPRLGDTSSCPDARGGHAASSHTLCP